MMIRATTAALLLGTLAMAAGNNENLRGNNNNNNDSKPQQEVEAVRRERVLQQMMSIDVDLGEMFCEERKPYDGSVVCTFRTIPPRDMSYGNLQHDCLYSSSTQKSFCLTSEVYRTPFGNFPSNQQQQQQQAAQIAVQPPPPVQQQPVQQQPPPVQQQQPVQLPFVGRCPSAPQATGMACARYIPSGSREVSCYFGRTQCNCAANDNPSVTEGWVCRPIPDNANGGQQQQQQQQQQQPVQQRPVTNPVTVVTTPVTNIDANINQQTVVAPTMPPAQSGNILPNFVNSPSCPSTEPANGTDCDWGQSCSYYRYTNGTPTSAVDCLCDANYDFQCVDTRRPGLVFP